MATLWVQVLDFCGYVRGQCTLALIGVHCTASPPLSSALLPHQITPVHSASFTVGGSDGDGVPIGSGVTQCHGTGAHRHPTTNALHLLHG
jgi:hypothetical protein